MSAELVGTLFAGGVGGSLLKFGGGVIHDLFKKKQSDEDQPAKDMQAIASGSVTAVESLTRTMQELEKRAKSAEERLHVTEERATAAEQRADHAQQAMNQALQKIDEVTNKASAWLVRAQQAEQLLRDHKIPFDDPEARAMS